LVCMSCFKKDGIVDNTRHEDGDNLTYRGNVFEMKTFLNDTVTVGDPITKEQTMAIVYRNPMPIKFNGKQIYDEKNVDKVPELTDVKLREYVFNNIEEELTKLGDGEYTFFISNIVMDDGGSIVLF